MKKFRGILAFSFIAFGLCCSAAQAQAKAMGTLTCQTGGSTALTLPVYAFTFNANTSANRYFTVYTDVSRLNDLLTQLYFVGSYDACTISGDSGLTFEQISIEDVDASGSAAGVQTANTQAYASMTFLSTFIQLDTSANAKLKPQTEAEKAKALADFRARGLALPK